MESKDDLFTISETSQKLRIPKHTLRFWEREFNGLFAPIRTKGRQRRYTAADIVLIDKIKRLRDEGISLSEIKKGFSFGDGDDLTGSSRIDLLAQRVAEVVKVEVYNFFRE